MPYNLPTSDPNQLSFGPGVIYMALAGTTPADDVGAVDAGMTLTHGVDILDVLQGSPRKIIASFRQVETVNFAFTGFEWKVDNLPKYLGGGKYDAGPPETYGFGGTLRCLEVSMKLIHQMPPNPGKTVGDCVELRVWKARSAGDLALTFGTDLHNFPLTFLALDAGTEWGCAGCPALEDGERYYRITRIAAP